HRAFTTPWFNEFYWRTFAALVVVAVSGGYIVTATKPPAAMLFAIGFVIFGLHIAFRLAVKIIDARSPDTTNDPDGDRRDNRRGRTDHPIHRRNQVVCQAQEAGSSG